MIINGLILAASALILVAFVQYNHGIFTGKNSPAIVSWALFSFITILNGLTFLGVSSNWVLSMAVFTDAFICVATLLFALFHKNKNLEFDPIDTWAFILGLVAIIAWRVSSVTYGNWIVQVAYIIAFVPSYRNAWKNPANEPLIPWLIWTVAFTLNILAVGLSPVLTVTMFVTPVVDLANHVAMSLLALRKKHPVLL